MVPPTDFLDLSVTRSLVEREKRSILDFGIEGIVWDIFDETWNLTSVESSLNGLFEDPSRSVYIGATTSPQWRWQLCIESDTGMKPHKSHYEHMWVLCCDRSPCISAIEELLIGKYKATHGNRVLNSGIYMPGPLPTHGALFLYACVVR